MTSAHFYCLANGQDGGRTGQNGASGMIHYDPHKWLDHLFDIRGTLVREISYRVMACVVWAALVLSIHNFVRPVGIGVTIHSLVGVALGLLLVFRTNASYDRFWEGRKLWGGIVNESRNLARTSTVFLADEPERQSAPD